MDITKVIYNSCHNPQKILIFNAATQQKEWKLLPCGKCLHCRITRVNEWVTRLYAQEKYSKNVYFITLDYSSFCMSDPSARLLAAETHAVKHNININDKEGFHPLLLCRNHLQDYFKRLRKNTGKKFQYFACGEYGSTYNRPHFHAIIFSDDFFTDDDFTDSWTVNNYRIGRVDIHNLRENGTIPKFGKQLKSNNILYQPKNCYKYVCKYLQKDSCAFGTFKTWSFIKKEFEKSLPDNYKEILFWSPEEAELVYSKHIEQMSKEFAPFVCCSRRPAIGFKYFEENVERFQKSDFRLFGLSEDNLIFPHYFVRKTKESLCPFDTYSKTSEKPCSSSRLPTLVSLLAQIEDYRLSIDSLFNPAAPVWCDYFKGTISFRKGENRVLTIPYSELHIYDRVSRVFFQFNCGYYTLWQKVRGIGYVKLSDMDISDVLRIVRNECEFYMYKYVYPSYERSLQLEKEKNDAILANFGSMEEFNKQFELLVQQQVACDYHKQLEYNNNKINF